MHRARLNTRAFKRLAQNVRANSSATKDKPFDKILIANRGEISVRVTKTAHKLGIKTVAIYSDPDAAAVHVRAADEAVCVGPAPSSQSYLNIPRVIEAIEKTGAQAVHPGYGFLSENSNFVAELEKRNITFIGPGAAAMDALGDKIHSKQLAIKAGVNTVPGYLGDVPNAEEAVKIARDIGYPVMIKATAGGGGKGMRIAYSDDEVRMGYRLSKEEAKASFANDVIFVEKFIEEPRHIEIQLIADKYGNVVPLPERECTIQRRNQKVIEESPSVFLDEKTRRAMQEQAASLARSVGYVSAGTVEFLADKHKNFYFLEMNTRLQVEHPVTEMVSGVDLVELMLRVAAGEKLPSHLVDAPVPILGHAFESRVYAEDPLRGFLPSTGRLSRYIEPSRFAERDPFLSSSIREDSGVVQGSEISMFYDPMICKLITHGNTREEALDLMRASLDAYVIRGVGHNVAFLRDLCDHPRFVSGEMNTGFIKDEYPNGFTGVKLSSSSTDKLVATSAIMNAMRAWNRADVSGRSAAAPEPDVQHVYVTLGQYTESAAKAAKGEGQGQAQRHFAVRLNVFSREDIEDKWSPALEKAFAAAPAGDDCLWQATLQEVDRHGKALANSTATTVHLANVDWNVDSPLFLAGDVGANPSETVTSRDALRVQQLDRTPDGFRLSYLGAVEDVYVRSPQAFSLARHVLPTKEVDFSKVIASPMPGQLISVAVVPGQSVEMGQEIAVVEAMKMQNVLRSPKKAVIKSVKSKAGDTLALDQVIVEFEQ